MAWDSREREPSINGTLICLSHPQGRNNRALLNCPLSPALGTLGQEGEGLPGSCLVPGHTSSLRVCSSEQVAETLGTHTPTMVHAQHIVFVLRIIPCVTFKSTLANALRCVARKGVACSQVSTPLVGHAPGRDPGSAQVHVGSPPAPHPQQVGPGAGEAAAGPRGWEQQLNQDETQFGLE